MGWKGWRSRLECKYGGRDTLETEKLPVIGIIQRGGDVCVCDSFSCCAVL